MNSPQKNAVLPVILVFIILNGIIFLVKSTLQKIGFNIDFLIVANLILFLLTFIAFLWQQRGLKATNPNIFIRSVYASLILKMFICMIAFFIYGFLNKEKINKPALFTSMGLYIIYTVVEVNGLMKASRNKKNA